MGQLILLDEILPANMPSVIPNALTLNASVATSIEESSTSTSSLLPDL